MPTNWQGFYLDGRTAIKQPVAVHPTLTALHLQTQDGQRLTWPYHLVTQTHGSYEGEEVRLEYGTEIPQTLIVRDPGFLVDIQKVASANVRHLHDPRRRHARVHWTLLASLALVTALAGLYFWAIPAMATFVAPYVTPTWEQRLGDSALEYLAPTNRRCTDPERLAAIELILRQLTAAVPHSPYQIRVTIVDQPSLNAFALPGGHILLLRGLVEATETPEQLAGVLAHELQHILKQHSTRAILEQSSTSLLITAVTGDFTGALAFGVESARVLGTLRYSRLHEEEADREGMHLLQSAGVDPNEMIAFYRTLEETLPKQPDSPSYSYLSTHPSTTDRIANLTRLAGSAPVHPVSLLPGKDWKNVRAICSHQVPPSREA